MERVEYDPEIDPSIREEREAAEREKELSARIRIEIERYSKEKEQEKEQEEPPFDPDPTPTDTKKTDKDEEIDERIKLRKEYEREREEKRQEKARKRAENVAERRKAIQSVFTGSVLSSEWLQRMFPYLIGAAFLLLLYIGGIFHLQRLHRSQQRLEEQVRELSIKAVGYSAEKAQKTQRSAIVKRLEEKEIPLKEFPSPVKTVEGR